MTPSMTISRPLPTKSPLQRPGGRPSNPSISEAAHLSTDISFFWEFFLTISITPSNGKNKSKVYSETKLPPGCWYTMFWRFTKIT